MIRAQGQSLAVMGAIGGNAARGDPLHMVDLNQAPRGVEVKIRYWLTGSYA